MTEVVHEIASEAGESLAKKSKTAVVPEEPEPLSLACVPLGLECQLTKSLLVEPVFAPSGRCYSRVAIEQYVAEYGREPDTDEPIGKQQLVPALAIAALLQRWKHFVAEHGNLFDCLICHQFVIDPVCFSCCGRCVCLACGDDYKELTSGTPKCPVCR
jgi:hypothetical protein